MMDENIKKIRAMVEGMLSQMEESKYSEWWDGVYNSCKGILSLLSDLEKSLPTKVGDGDDKVLEVEAVSYCFDNGLNISPRVAADFARHFYDIGCRRTAEKYDEIEYNRQRASGSSEIPNDLEEAAKKYEKERPYNDFVSESIKLAFIAGAKWQKQHDAELIEIAYNDGITIGMTKQKEQMLKDAEECELYWDGVSLAIDLNMMALGYSEGDKVRVIIIKKEGEK